MYHHDFNEKIGFWYVIALAGQSNGMAYGEGIPLPDTLDKPESRVKQLARRKTITPGGKECKFNEIIPADHCLHDVSRYFSLLDVASRSFIAVHRQDCGYRSAWSSGCNRVRGE